MCTVSVIIPVFNAAPYLRGCLDSVLNQTLNDIEVICIDDGSTDGSGAVLAEYAGKHARVRVLTQVNAGQGAARNRGLERATGEFVYFIDADDELAAQDALALLVETMGANLLDVLFFDARTEVDEGVAVSESVVRASDYVHTCDYSGVYSGRELLSAFLKNREFCVSPCLMMLRREFVDENRLRFPEARIFYEDNIFMTCVLLAAKRASHRPWQLYVRKVHAGSTVTSKPTLRHLRGYLACYRDACSLLERQDWDRPTRAALVDRRVIYKLHVRRLVDAYPGLVAKMKRSFADEGVELEKVLSYPLGEKLVNAFRCLRDRGVIFTVKRVLFGRQS